MRQPVVSRIVASARSPFACAAALPRVQWRFAGKATLNLSEFVKVSFDIRVLRRVPPIKPCAILGSDCRPSITGCQPSRLNLRRGIRSDRLPMPRGVPSLVPRATGTAEAVKFRMSYRFKSVPCGMRSLRLIERKTCALMCWSKVSRAADLSSPIVGRSLMYEPLRMYWVSFWATSPPTCCSMCSLKRTKDRRLRITVVPFYSVAQELIPIDTPSQMVRGGRGETLPRTSN